MGAAEALAIFAAGVAAGNLPELVSRFRRFKSARKSAALW